MARRKASDLVVMPKSEYEELLENSQFLQHLENAGLDNWAGYDEALSTYNSQLEDDG